MSNIKGKKYEVINVWRGYGKLDDLFEIGDIVVALENNSFAPLVIYEKYYSDELADSIMKDFYEGTLDDKYWEMIDTMRLSQLRELDD